MTPTRNTLVGRVTQGGSRRGGRPIGLTRPRYRPCFRRGSTRQPTRTVVVRTVVAVCIVARVVVARRGVAGRRPRG